jgi:hypothetical protein
MFTIYCIHVRLIPFPLLGLGGSITWSRDYYKNRVAMFDIVTAGPAAGILASLTALIVGLQVVATPL